MMVLNEDSLLQTIDVEAISNETAFVASLLEMEIFH